MEIRTLQYFLAIAREGSISKAAEFLHLTQPTLSRQMKELEEEFGKELFVRGNRKITLTEDGMFLRKRAEEIISLVEKTEMDMLMMDQEISGDIYIGAGETEAMSIFAKVIHHIQDENPGIKFHLYSGNAQDVSDKLDKGLLDFGIVLEPVDVSRYDFIKLPMKDRWGVLMRKDSPFASTEKMTPQDLRDLPLICSSQEMVKNELAGWIGGNQRKFNIVATYNLVFNASLLVREGVGYALTLDKLVNTDCNSELCFVPLEPQLEVGLVLVWKKYQLFSKQAEYFLNMIQKELLSQKG